MPPEPSGIIFENSYSTYFAGDKVDGRIQLVLPKPKDIKGISLHIKGSASVKWTVQQTTYVNGRTQYYTVTYYAEEEYFKMKYYCIGGKDHDTITLPAGTHIYPFSFVLPENLPSSFEGVYGNIRYIAKFVLERPWKWNQETKIAFTVISPYDLNNFPNLLSPMKVIEEKYFCCGCCKSGPLTAIVRIPKTGYVCGERISILVEIDNASKELVQNVTLKLQQFTSFYSQYPSRDVRTDTKVFEKMKLGPVKPQDSQTWNRSLLIPPLPPCSLARCTFIESEYQLLLEASVGTFHMNLKLLLPITIGTVPFRLEDVHLGNRTPPPDYETAISVYPNDVTVGWVATPSPSAPLAQTFEQNVAFNVRSIEDTEDNKYTKYNNSSKGYTPSYPMYTFNYNA